MKRYEQFVSKYGIYGIFELHDGAVMRHHELVYIQSLTSGFKKLELCKTQITTMNGNTAKSFRYIGCKPDL